MKARPCLLVFVGTHFALVSGGGLVVSWHPFADGRYYANDNGNAWGSR